MRKNIFPFRKYRRKKLFLQKREKKKKTGGKEISILSPIAFTSNLSFIHRCNYNFLQYLEN